LCYEARRCGGAATAKWSCGAEADQVEHSGTLGTPLASFTTGDTVDLAALKFVASGGATLDGSVLTVTEGAHHERITFSAGASFGGESWQLGWMAIAAPT